MGGILCLPAIFPPACTASITGAPHNSQDVEEDVDDVGVEVKGSKNVLLWTQGQFLVAQEKLSVHSQKLHRWRRMPLVISKDLYINCISSDLLFLSSSEGILFLIVLSHFY